MTITCPEGVVLEKGQPCPECGANQMQTCIKHRKKLAAERAKRIAQKVADRAEARRSRS
jgi:hypothetical protein